jgi:biopolymer transport protein ExbD
MARRKPSERAHGGHEEHEAVDLDVTPFLNILFMLILSILAMTSWTQLAMLNVAAPTIGGGGDGSGSGTPAEVQSQLNLTVFILKDGFNVGASGATLDGNSDGRPGEVLIPMVAGKDGKPTYDYKKLQARLIEIKKSFIDEEAMIVSADGAVPYEVVIRVMDVARRSPDGRLLFPAVAFAAGVVG